MASSLLESPTIDAGSTARVEHALSDYATLVWRAPQAEHVYGMLDDGVLEAYVVGGHLSSEQYRAIFRAQEQVELLHPELEWSFHVFDRKGTLSQIPLPRESNSFRILRPVPH